MIEHNGYMGIGFLVNKYDLEHYFVLKEDMGFYFYLSGISGISKVGVNNPDWKLFDSLDEAINYDGPITYSEEIVAKGLSKILVKVLDMDKRLKDKGL